MVEEVSLPMLRDARLIASPVTGSDAGHVHVENLRAHPEHYGRNLRLRLIVDLLIPGHILQTATRARSIMRREWLKLLSPYDVLIAPTLMYTLKKISYANPDHRAGPGPWALRRRYGGRDHRSGVPRHPGNDGPVRL